MLCWYTQHQLFNTAQYYLKYENSLCYHDVKAVCTGCVMMSKMLPLITNCSIMWRNDCCLTCHIVIIHHGHVREQFFLGCFENVLVQTIFFFFGNSIFAVHIVNSQPFEILGRTVPIKISMLWFMLSCRVNAAIPLLISYGETMDLFRTEPFCGLFLYLRVKNKSHAEGFAWTARVVKAYCCNNFQKFTGYLKCL